MCPVPLSRSRVTAFLMLAAISACAASRLHAKPLEIYFVDTEGGQATLLVTPSGQSMLIDTGWPGNSGRDPARIAAAAKAAGVKKIDYLLITHFHSDHVGGITGVTDRFPVGTFLDYGPSVEEGGKYPEPYAAAFAKGEHRAVKPGDKIALKGVDATVVIAGGKHIERPGEPNPYCAGLAPDQDEDGENSNSAGVLIQYGKFRFADLGDVLYNGELALECPENKLGRVDLYLTAHHGTHVPPKSTWGLAPRVIVMNNGPRKGGFFEAWELLNKMPGLEDLWQLHYAIEGGAGHNVPDARIANLDERNCPGNYLKVSAEENGSFMVYNLRNKYQKTYAAK